MLFVSLLFRPETRRKRRVLHAGRKPDDVLGYLCSYRRPPLPETEDGAIQAEGLLQSRLPPLFPPCSISAPDLSLLLLAAQ